MGRAASILLSPTVLYFIAALGLSLYLLTSSLLPTDKIDPLVLLPVLLVFFAGVRKLYKPYVLNPVWPYLSLQLVIFGIMLEEVFFRPFGLSLKVYAVMFLFACLSAAYYLFRHFRYLWSVSVPFRLLFLFLLANMFYFLFYHSEFRSYYGLYHEVWVVNATRFGQRALTGGQAGQFQESGLLAMYLTMLSPFIAFIIPLMLTRSDQTAVDRNNTVARIIRYFIYALSGFFLLSGLGAVLGLSHYHFTNGQFYSNFFGLYQGVENIFSVFFILLAGFRLIIHHYAERFEGTRLPLLTDLLLATCGIFILLPLKKTPLIALAVAMVLFSLAARYFQFLPVKKNIYKTRRQALETFYKTMAGMAAALLVYFLNQNFIIATIGTLTERFGSMQTLDQRATIWHYFMNDWANELGLFQLFFGFGLDASRELAYFTSSMLPRDVDTLSSIHNFYLQMAYEYGLVSLLFFGALGWIMLDNLIVLFKRDSDRPILKILCMTSVSLLIYLALYYYTESPVVPVLLMTFSVIGLLEALKLAYKRIGA